MIHKDNSYIVGLRNNDNACIQSIYKQYSEKIKQLVLHNNGNENDAADIFQEALVYIYNRAHNSTFALTCPFEAYLYMVCKNKWITVLQKRKNNKVTLTEDVGYSINDADTSGIAIMEQKEEKIKLIENAVDKIGNSCAALLKLSWQGIHMQEVGKQLNMTYAYVRKKKSECMGKLIDLIKKEPAYQMLIN